MQNNPTENALIAEYNAIRQSNETKNAAQNTLFIFALTAVGTILSFSFQRENPYIALVSYAVLISVRCRVMWFRDTIFRSIAYLRIFVEPKLQINNDGGLKVKEYTISKIHYWIYTFLGAATLLTYLANNPDNCVTFLLAIAFFLVVILLDIYYVSRSGKVYQYYKNQWAKVRDEK